MMDMLKHSHASEHDQLGFIREMEATMYSYECPIGGQRRYEAFSIVVA
jgi:hypothetical protein